MKGITIGVLVTTVAGVIAGCASAPSGDCPEMSDSGVWELGMHADNTEYRVEGVIRFDPEGRTDLTAISEGGSLREPLEYPLDSLQVIGDSIRFVFAPIGFVMRGRCVTADSMVGRFSVPQPPFDNIEGSWNMTRQQ